MDLHVLFCKLSKLLSWLCYPKSFIRLSFFNLTFLCVTFRKHFSVDLISLWLLLHYLCLHPPQEWGRNIPRAQKNSSHGGSPHASMAAGSQPGCTLIQGNEIIFTTRIRKYSCASHFTLALFWMQLSAKPICFAGKLFLTSGPPKFKILSLWSIRCGLAVLRGTFLDAQEES